MFVESQGFLDQLHNLESEQANNTKFSMLDKKNNFHASTFSRETLNELYG